MTQTNVLFAGIAALMVLVVGATVAFIPSTPAVTNTTRTLQIWGQESSRDGLILGASLNASVIPPGNAVSVRIWEVNSLDAQNNVTSAAVWAYDGLSLGPCGHLSDPFGFKVLSGYYSANSSGISSAQPVQIFPPGFYACPVIFNVGSYSFYPRSSEAILGGFCTPGPCFTYTMNVTSDITREFPAGFSNPIQLPSGEYTVVVGDEWGASVLLHFAVALPGTTAIQILHAGASFQVTSSYDCIAGNYQLQFASPTKSVLTGGFTASTQGVTLYVASSAYASDLVRGHPAQWAYLVDLGNSSNFRVDLSQGSYVLWFEGADINCGAKIVMPLEMLTQVNITRSFNLMPA